MKVESIHVGKPTPVTFRGKEVLTSIFKKQIPGPVMLRTLDLDGDEQADLRVHGGPDKALYAYGSEAYEAWRKLRPQDSFPPGAMGENLAMTTLPEDEIFIGDTYRLGQAVVQVAQPRFPCFKLGIKFNDAQIISDFVELERPGVYFRVIQEGLVDVGDLLEIDDQEVARVSVLEIFQINSARTLDTQRLREILQVRGLTPQWREKIQDLVESDS